MGETIRENREIISSIDIGTTKVSALIVELQENNGFKILGSGMAQSDGLSKGIVVDIHKTTEAIIDAVSQAEKQAGQQIDGAFIGLTGEHIKGINYSGVTSISNPGAPQSIGQEITKSDINRVLEQAKSINVSPDRRIMHILPQKYKIDNN